MLLRMGYFLGKGIILTASFISRSLETEWEFHAHWGNGQANWQC